MRWMKPARSLLLLAGAAVAACQVPPRLQSADQAGGVISVAELHANREAYDGRVVRVVGFLSEDQQTFQLDQGSPVTPDCGESGFGHCCYGRGIESLWIPKEDLRRTWRSIRRPELSHGRRVILEGTFANEVVPMDNPDGTINSTIVVGMDDVPLRRSEYHGMGPLRNARVLALLPGRCSFLDG